MPSLGFLTSAPLPRKLPIGPSAVDAWDEICRGMGITVLPPEEAANLPPWTEEVDVLERMINEAFERIEEPPKLS